MSQMNQFQYYVRSVRKISPSEYRFMRQIDRNQLIRDWRDWQKKMRELSLGGPNG